MATWRLIHRPQASNPFVGFGVPIKARATTFLIESTLAGQNNSSLQQPPSQCYTRLSSVIRASRGNRSSGSLDCDTSCRRGTASLGAGGVGKRRARVGIDAFGRLCQMVSRWEAARCAQGMERWTCSTWCTKGWIRNRRCRRRGIGASLHSSRPRGFVHLDALAFTHSHHLIHLFFLQFRHSSSSAHTDQLAVAIQSCSHLILEMRTPSFARTRPIQLIPPPII